MLSRGTGAGRWGWGRGLICAFEAPGGCHTEYSKGWVGGEKGGDPPYAQVTRDQVLMLRFVGRG